MTNLNQIPGSMPGSVLVPRLVRCLLLDDSNFDRARIRRMARQTDLAIQMDEAECITQLSAAVQEERYDIVLIDYRLPIGDGMVALEHVMNSLRNKDAGKIMITGDGARQTAIKAMRAGCHDFLTKEEMNAKALREAIANALITSQRRKDLQQEVAAHEEAARHRRIIAIQDNNVDEKVVSLLRARKLNWPIDRFAELDATEVDNLLRELGDQGDNIIH